MHGGLLSKTLLRLMPLGPNPNPNTNTNPNTNPNLYIEVRSQDFPALGGTVYSLFTHARLVRQRIWLNDFNP